MNILYFLPHVINHFRLDRRFADELNYLKMRGMRRVDLEVFDRFERRCEHHVHRPFAAVEVDPDFHTQKPVDTIGKRVEHPLDFGDMHRLVFLFELEHYDMDDHVYPF